MIFPKHRFGKFLWRQEMERTPTAIVACASYDADAVRRALEEALAQVGGLDWVTPGMRIGIKLNLCAGLRPEKAATTHPVMAAELTKMLISRGATVVLGDSPGEPFAAVVLSRIYGVAGLSLCEEAGGQLNHDFSHHMVEDPDAVTAKSFAICDWVEKCDAIISFSKLKAHGLMGMTAAVKNIYGVIPGTVKSEYHFRYTDPMAFAEMMVDLNEYVKPRLYLCDAVEAMEGNGPTQGTARHMGALLAGVDPYAMDRVCAYLINLDERELLYLEAAKRRGLLSPDGKPDNLETAKNFRIPDFKRSGATSSWFALDPDDGAFRRLLKKGLALIMRSRPKLRDGCVGCGHCAELCPAGAITIRDKKAVIDRKKCVRCFCCQEFCPTGAMRVQRTLIARILEK